VPELRTLRDTARLGAAIAKILAPGDLVLVSGELGAGKTTLVRFAARALGVRDRVTSPTFSLVHEYEGRQGRVVHADLYRLREGRAPLEDEVARLGLRQLRREGAIVFVEWGDEAVDVLGGAPTLVVRLTFDSASGRRAALSGSRADGIV
jgi:tRNA threonylcarbamoyladenosine biosynthesis protein TsaE